MFVSPGPGAIGFLSSMSTVESSGTTKSSKLPSQPAVGAGRTAVPRKEAGKTLTAKRSRVARFTTLAASPTSSWLKTGTGRASRARSNGTKFQVKSSMNVPPSLRNGHGRSTRTATEPVTMKGLGASAASPAAMLNPSLNLKMRIDAEPPSRMEAPICFGLKLICPRVSR
jgi:hypothetical protein